MYKVVEHDPESSDSDQSLSDKSLSDEEFVGGVLTSITKKPIPKKLLRRAMHATLAWPVDDVVSAKVTARDKVAKDVRKLEEQKSQVIGAEKKAKASAKDAIIAVKESYGKKTPLDKEAQEELNIAKSKLFGKTDKKYNYIPKYFIQSHPDLDHHELDQEWQQYLVRRKRYGRRDAMNDLPKVLGPVKSIQSLAKFLINSANPAGRMLDIEEARRRFRELQEQQGSVVTDYGTDLDTQRGTLFTLLKLFKDDYQRQILKKTDLSNIIAINSAITELRKNLDNEDVITSRTMSSHTELLRGASIPEVAAFLEESMTVQQFLTLPALLNSFKNVKPSSTVEGFFKYIGENYTITNQGNKQDESTWEELRFTTTNKSKRGLAYNFEEVLSAYIGFKVINLQWNTHAGRDFSLVAGDPLEFAGAPGWTYDLPSTTFVEEAADQEKGIVSNMGTEPLTDQERADAIESYYELSAALDDTYRENQLADQRLKDARRARQPYSVIDELEKERVRTGESFLKTRNNFNYIKGALMSAGLLNHPDIAAERARLAALGYGYADAVQKKHPHHYNLLKQFASKLNTPAGHALLRYVCC